MGVRVLLRLLSLFALSAAVAGCAAVGRLGYDNLPTLAMWRVDTYLALNAEQKARAARGFEGLHTWHRNSQLDGYSQWLAGVQREVADGSVSEADLRRWREDIFQRFMAIADQAAPAIAEVVLTLEPAQVARMKAEFARDNDKLRKEWMPADRAERVEARTKRYLERGEFFLGKLTDAQKQTARRMAAEAPPAEEQWMAQRIGRQQDLLALFERIRSERPPVAQATQWIRDHVARYGQFRDGPERQITESSLSAGDAMSVALFAQATPRQRQHLQRKLQDWIDLAQALRPESTARGGVGTLASQP